jgi:hypothetical protein
VEDRDESERTHDEESVLTSIARGAAAGVGVGTSLLVREARSWLRWLGAGAAGGAVVLGGAGLYYFGWDGLALGAGAGAVLGAVLIIVLYFLAATADIF